MRKKECTKSVEQLENNFVLYAICNINIFAFRQEANPSESEKKKMNLCVSFNIFLLSISNALI